MNIPLCIQRLGSAVKIYIDLVDKTYDGTMTQVADTATVDNGVSYYDEAVEVR